MSRESISRETFIKGVAAGAVVAASLGTLRFAEYSTADKAKKHSRQVPPPEDFPL